MISYNDAYNIIKNELNSLSIGYEYVSLLLSAGRALAEDIYSDIDLPSFDNSSMDGICVDFSEGIKNWNIKGEISAGNYYETVIRGNEGVIIMTGGKIPAGGSAVIPVEDINIVSDKATLKTNAAVKTGQNIRRAAQDMKKGELIASLGSTIKPVCISLLSACGVEKVKVQRKLNFGVFVTGDELVDISENPVNDKIRASNLYTLISLVESLGMNCSNYGIVKDDKEEAKLKISAAISDGADIILTSGGVSVGKYDIINDALIDLGAEILFWKVCIKPGKPLLFAAIKHGNRKILFFGLPGNPVSAIVNFIIFIKRAILETYYKCFYLNQKAVLLNDIMKSDNKRHFVRGLVKYNQANELYEILTDENQSSSNMAGLSKANALAVIEENCFDPRRGDIVECIMI